MMIVFGELFVRLTKIRLTPQKNFLIVKARPLARWFGGGSFVN